MEFGCKLCQPATLVLLGLRKFTSQITFVWIEQLMACNQIDVVVTTVMLSSRMFYIGWVSRNVQFAEDHHIEELE